MQELKIRLIEDHVLARLKEEARDQNIGLETLARNILIDHALHPEIRKVEDKYEKLVRDLSGIYRSLADEVVSALEENTELLERMKAIMNRGGNGQ